MALLNLNDIFELIDKVADRGIGLVEIESAGMRVRVEGRRADPPQGAAVAPPAPSANVTLAAVEASGKPVTKAPIEEEVDSSWHIITSPIVGTFYEAANPESDPFMRVGDRVSKGAVLCIIEAMKLMNEIESDVEGEIVRVFPKNGQPIEYGEKLFALKLS